MRQMRLLYEAFLLERFEEWDLWFVAYREQYKTLLTKELDEDDQLEWAFALLGGEKLQQEWCVKQVLAMKGVDVSRIEVLDAGTIGRLPMGRDMYVKVMR